MPFPVSRVEIFSASILDQAFTNDITSTAENAFSKYLELCGISGVTVNSTYANSGHNSTNYVSKLPAFLSSISGVSNVVTIMHGPGNDVTDNGPYPGGTTTMQNNMTTVASGIVNAGHRLMWGPISYRIPPASNSPEPYNLNIINPLAKQYSPDFYSGNTPIFDMYTYSFDRQNEFEGDGVHPSTPMEHFYRTYLARILAQQALGLTPLAATAFVGKTVVLNVGNVLTYQQLISPAFCSAPSGGTTNASVSAPTMRATDFTNLWGTWIESRNLGGVNNAGRGNGSNATATLLNNNLLLSSAYIGVETKAIGSSYVYIKGLPNGLSGTVAVVGSRNVTGTDRMCDFTIQGVTQRCDGAATTPDIKVFNFTITDNQLTIKMDVPTGSTFGYLSGIKLDFLSYADPCGTNLGSSGGPATGYQGSPSQTDFEAFWSENNLAYLGISPSEPDTFYTGMIRVGPLNVERNTPVTGTLTWDTDRNYDFPAYKSFIFRVYGVKNTRSAQIGIGNLPTAQVLTTSFVEINTANWTGSSNSGFWKPVSQVIDVSPILNEMISNACFIKNNFPQFVFIPQSYPFGQGYVTFGGQGSGKEIKLNYAQVVAPVVDAVRSIVSPVVSNLVIDQSSNLVF